METWQLLSFTAFLLASYVWGGEKPGDLSLRHPEQFKLSESNLPPAGKREPRAALHIEEESLVPKKRKPRHAQENAYPDPDTFLKLLELVKAVSATNPSNNEGRPSRSKFRSFDDESYPARPAERIPQRMEWRQLNEEDDYGDERKPVDGRRPEWKRGIYDDMRPRNLPDGPPQNWWPKPDDA